MDEEKLWLIGIGVFVVLVLLLRLAIVRGVIGRWLKPVGERLAEWVNPPPPFDPVADDLAKALRRERLQADVRRLQHLLATDEWMSATRQMGNRLAYDWLVRELDRSTRSISPLFVSDDTYGNWDLPGSASRSARWRGANPHSVRRRSKSWRSVAGGALGRAAELSTLVAGRSGWIVK